MSDKITMFERMKLRAKLVKAVRLIADIDPYIIHVSPNEMIFAVPHGTNPADLHEKSYVFRQVFGANTELSGNLKRFKLTIPKGSMPRKITFKLGDWRADMKSHEIPIICGIDSIGKRVVFDLAVHPHILLSGETGSGKSSLLRVILSSLILSQDPKNIRLVLGDMKRSEFGIYRNLPHVDSVSVDKDSLESELMRIDSEMKRRGDLLDAEEVTHIRQLKNVSLPYYIVVIDEVVRIRKEKRIMRIIEDISSIGRSLGVLLILSMQRPDSTVLDGLLKNNLTVRISGRQSNASNANIAGLPGAETIGMTESGRMLINLDGIKRIQAPWLDEEIAKRILKPLKQANSDVNYGRDNEHDAVEEQDRTTGTNIIDFSGLNLRNKSSDSVDREPRK